MKYRIFADATADLSERFMAGLPQVEIIPMQVEICGREYTYGPGGNLTNREFYKLQREGNFATTSQINPSTYIRYFEPVLKDGEDILYLCFSSGMSSTYASAQIAARELADLYPDRKIVCIDSKGATQGEALMIREATRMQQSGATLEETAQWMQEHRMRVCYGVIVDTFDHLKHGGRVSSSAAVMGTMLQIKPMLRVDEDGKLEVIGKPRGRKKAYADTVERMAQSWSPELGKTVLIVHGDCPEYAEGLKAQVAARFPDAEIEIDELGPVIGAHTGPGLLALIYWGSNR